MDNAPWEEFPPGAFAIKAINSEVEMMTIDERALLVEVDDQLIKLYVEQGDAKRADEFGRVCELQIEINELRTQHKELRNLDAEVENSDDQLDRPHDETAHTRQSHH
jgi:hypothetical protein